MAAKAKEPSYKVGPYKVEKDVLNNIYFISGFMGANRDQTDVEQQCSNLNRAYEYGYEKASKENAALVEQNRLISNACRNDHKIIKELKSSNAALLAALEPFAAFAENDGTMLGKGDDLYTEHAKVRVTLLRSDCIKARAAIKAAGGGR